MIAITRRTVLTVLVAALLATAAWSGTPEIRIFGTNDEIIAEYERSGHWGEMGVDFE
jgi:hypothetical protein